MMEKGWQNKQRKGTAR